MSKSIWFAEFISLCVGVTPAIAEVKTDTSTNTIVNKQDNVFNITGGVTVGGRNLFHSFEQFDIPTQEVANFLNDAGIVNIFSRVTGGKVSEIDGVLRSQGSANFFLMNPSGIVFGQNASLDVGGSFVATTANAIQFSDRGTFRASLSPVSDVLTVDPSAFLFSQTSPAPIVNQSISNTGFKSPLGFSLNGLKVTDGKNLLLIGGDVTIDGGKLSTLGGRIELGGLAEAGTVELQIEGDIFRATFPKNRLLANATLAKDAQVALRGASGGNIAINTNNFTAIDGGRLLNETEGAGDAGNTIINTNIFNAIGQNAEATGSGIYNISRGTGRSGNIKIDAEKISILDGAVIISSTVGQGSSGDVALTVQDTVTLNGGGNGLRSFAGSVVQPSATGRGGNLTLSAGSLSVSNGAQLTSVTAGQGDAGNVTLSVRDTAIFDGIGNNQPSGSGSTVEPTGVGNGGNLMLKAGSLTVVNGAILSSSTLGRGDAGNVTLTVQNAAIFDGVSRNGLPRSGVGSTVQPTGVGKGGNIKLDAGSLAVTNGAIFSSSTEGQGDAGDVMLNVRDIAIFDGGSSNGFSSIVTSGVGSTATGKGGMLTLNAGSLSLTNGAILSSSTYGQGNAGNVVLNVRDTAILDGTGDNGLPSIVVSGVGSAATGKGGTLTLNTNLLTVTNGAFLSSTTEGQGNAGNVVLNVRDTAIFDGEGVNGPSGVGSVVGTTATGKGGTLTLNAGSLSLTNGATLSSSSMGIGNAGDLTVRVQDRFQLFNRGTVATASQTTNGGSINIAAKSIFLLTNSNISTAVLGGAGKGGDIGLKADTIVALDDSNVFAFSPEGQGGNILFRTQAFLSDPLFRPSPPITDTNALINLLDNGRVDVNASGTVSGAIVGVPSITFLQNSLTQLSRTAIDTNTLLANSCIARNQQNGSFYITGTGGVSTNPGEFSTYSTGTVQPANSATRWKRGDALIEPQGVYHLPNGNLILSRECP